MKSFKFIKILVLLIFLSTSVINCSEEELDGTESSPSTGDGGGGVGSTPVGTVDDTGLWIHLVNTEFPMYVHQVSDFSEQCVIASDATKGQALDCVVDIVEGDLYLYDLEIQYNAAPNLCENVVVLPPWHWNESSGIGPTAVTVDIDTSIEPPAVTNCVATDQSAASGPCSANLELTDVGNIAGPTCIYDHTETFGNNCCFGEYVLTINTDTDGIGGTDTTTTEVTSWGGEDVSSCLGGMFVSAWDEKNKQGYPWPLITPVAEAEEDENGVSVEGNGGLNASYVLTSNASTSASGFSTYANWYETTGTPHNHDGYILATTTNLPYAINPIDDLDGTPYIAPFVYTSSPASAIRYGNDAFTVICQDEGNEEIHRINLYIREWNTSLDFDAYGTSSGAAADYDPDVVGTEGVNCNLDGPVGGSCNDFRDMDDLAVGGYLTPAPGPATAEARKAYFPGVDYD